MQEAAIMIHAEQVSSEIYTRGSKFKEVVYETLWETALQT